MAYFLDCKNAVLTSQYLLTLYHVLTELMVNGVLAHPPMLGRIDAPMASQTIGISLLIKKQ